MRWTLPLVAFRLLLTTAAALAQGQCPPPPCRSGPPPIQPLNVKLHSPYADDSPIVGPGRSIVVAASAYDSYGNYTQRGTGSW